jgi:uncharacterized protein YjiS (DUF1127 family)
MNEVRATKEPIMNRFFDFVAAIRHNGRRRAALRDLRYLTAEQLADVGIEPDHLGEVVDAMLTDGRATRARDHLRSYERRQAEFA